MLLDSSFNLFLCALSARQIAIASVATLFGSSALSGQLLLMIKLAKHFEGHALLLNVLLH